MLLGRASLLRPDSALRQLWWGSLRRKDIGTTPHKRMGKSVHRFGAGRDLGSYPARKSEVFFLLWQVLLLLRRGFHVFIEPAKHFPNHVLDGFARLVAVRFVG